MFASWRSFQLFEKEVNSTRRYILTPKSRDFLSSLLNSLESRVEVLESGTRLWRARLGHDWRKDGLSKEEVPCPYERKGMKPLRNEAMEGRVNPKGIPYLYMATRPETAMSEVRPWVGTTLSLGTFRTNRELQLVNCAKFHDSGLEFYENEPEPKNREKSVWSSIDRAFSRPVTHRDSRADYAPTQMLAEVFKDAGFDGLYYKSAFGKQGYNVAVFDLNAADLMQCDLHTVEKIAHYFDEASDGYSVSKSQ